MMIGWDHGVMEVSSVLCALTSRAGQNVTCNFTESLRILNVHSDCH